MDQSVAFKKLLLYLFASRLLTKFEKIDKEPNVPPLVCTDAMYLSISLSLRICLTDSYTSTASLMASSTVIFLRKGRISRPVDGIDGKEREGGTPQTP